MHKKDSDPEFIKEGRNGLQEQLMSRARASDEKKQDEGGRSMV